MHWVHDNADRDFSADAPNETETELRDLLKTSEVTDYFDEVARMRMGSVISRAVFDPSKV
jgi:DNA replication initiation complex subunit (GINS family)